MATLTTTADDTSPMFQWLPPSSWAPASSEQDRALSSYYRSTAMYTNFTDAKMSFTFFGNSIKIYGSKRENHGMFQVQFDNQTYDPQSGFANLPGSFQQELFSKDGLTDELHVVIIKNLEAGKYLDIDSVTWQSALSTVQEPSLVLTVQDTSETIQWKGTWAVNPDNVGSFFGGTGHMSRTPGSFMQYSFTGSAIAIYGPADPNGAPYSVQLDDEAPQNFSVISSTYIPQSLLYFRAGIEKGKRSIKVTHTGTRLDKVLAIDYLNVFTTPSLDAVSGSKLSSSVIGAIAAGTVTVVVLFVISMFYCISRGHEREKPQSRFFTWWNYKEGGIFGGLKRVTKRKERGKVERINLDEGEYTAVGATDREGEYLIPNYGPPGSTGLTSSGGGRVEGDAADAERSSVDLSLLGSGTSRALSHSTARHSRLQTSLSGLSVLNQPPVRPIHSPEFGIGDISSGESHSPPPLDACEPSVPQGASPTVATNRPLFLHTRTLSASPPPNKSRQYPNPTRHPTILQPFSLGARLLTHHSQSASEFQSSSRINAEPSQSALQEEQTIPPSLSPGAGKPVPSAYVNTSELGELTSTGSAVFLGGRGGSTSGPTGGPGTLGRSGSAGTKGSAVVGPRARSLTGASVSKIPDVRSSIALPPSLR